MKHYGVDVEETTNLNHHVIIPGGIGTITNPKALDISFTLRIDNPAIVSDEKSAYDVLWRINFSNDSPITVFIGIDTNQFEHSTLDANGNPSNPIANGTPCMYIGDTYSGEDRELELVAGVEYKITFEFRKEANDVYRLKIYVGDKLVDDTTTFNAVDAYKFTHLDFTAQTRSYYDLYLDDVTFKSCSENSHLFEGAWTSTNNGQEHTNTCVVCNTTVTETCDHDCDKICYLCKYRDGVVSHTYGEWTKLEGKSNVYVATCTKCKAMTTATFNNNDTSKVEIKSDVAGAVGTVLDFYKNNTKNAEFIANFGAHNSNKVTFEFDVYVPSSATVEKQTSDKNYPNIRMIQLYISDFFNPYIAAAATAYGTNERELKSGYWSFGHLTRKDGQDVNNHFGEYKCDQWYKIKVDMYMTQGLAVVYVGDAKAGEYTGCNTSVDSISHVRFYTQMRYNGDIYFDNLSLTETDTSVDKNLNFENKLTDVNCSISGESTSKITTAIVDNKNVLEVTRPDGESTHFLFKLPTTEAAADAAVLSFKFYMKKNDDAQSDSGEIRIKFAEDYKTPYMASLILLPDGKFKFQDKRSSTNNVAEPTDIVFVSADGTIKDKVEFERDAWYTITIKLHIGCCDEFLAEWTVVVGETEYKAYSRRFARQNHDEIKPETEVKYVDFWAVGNNGPEYHFYLDDISIKAGGAGVIVGDHSINNAETSPIYVSDGAGHHYKASSCAHSGLADCDTLGVDGACSVCGYKETVVGEENT